MLARNKVNVLVAEDEHNMLGLLTSVLRSLEYSNVRHASDGLKALKVLEQEPIHLAFFDIDMPILDGIEVMKQAMELHPDCFCVIVSAHSALENVRAALDAGAKGFIVKPYNAKKVQDVLIKFERESKR